MLASAFVVGAVSALKNSEALAPKARKVTDKVVPLARKAAPGAPIPQDAQTLVRLNAAAQILAAAQPLARRAQIAARHRPVAGSGTGDAGALIVGVGNRRVDEAIQRDAALRVRHADACACEATGAVDRP